MIILGGDYRGKSCVQESQDLNSVGEPWYDNCVSRDDIEFDGVTTEYKSYYSYANVYF